MSDTWHLNPCRFCDGSTARASGAHRWCESKARKSQHPSPWFTYIKRRPAHGPPDTSHDSTDHHPEGDRAS